jgi:hypothetical protein
MNCYFAAKSRHRQFVGALGATGAPISCTWPSWTPNRIDTEPTDDEWAEHSERCLKEAAECDVLVLYAEQEDRHFGALLECGATLGAGKWVFLIAPHPWPFLRNHPRCRSFENLAEAVRAICALRDGERARDEAERSGATIIPIKEKPRRARPGQEDEHAEHQRKRAVAS